MKGVLAEESWLRPTARVLCLTPCKRRGVYLNDDRSVNVIINIKTLLCYDA